MIEIDPGEFQVVVVGGGAAGLAAARACARPGISVSVLEAADAVGGQVAAVQVAGVRVDAGAESFATRGGRVVALAVELGLADQVVEPTASGAWLQLRRGAVPLPKAALLGIPGSPLAADVVRAIGWAAAWRAYLDRVMPVLKVGRETNLGDLVRKRMGERVLDDLVAPITTSVYSSHPDEIDIDAAVPGLNGALTRLGSLSGAVLELRAAASASLDGRDAGSGAKAGSAVGGIQGGMSRLIDALVSDLAQKGVEIRTGCRVTRIERPRQQAAAGLTGPELIEAAPDGTLRQLDEASSPSPRPADDDASDLAATGDGAASIWRIRLADGSTVDADAVIVATPATAALELLAAIDTEPRGAGADADADADADEDSVSVQTHWPSSSVVELITLVVDAPSLNSAPRGTGVLVAETAPQARAKALTHASAKWQWIAEAAGADRHVLRLSYGRPGREPETLHLDDESACRLALQDASALLGTHLSASVGFARTVWTTAPPATILGQRERIAGNRAQVARVDGLEVTGAWVSGTGLASVIPDAEAAAARIRSYRWRPFTADL